MGSKKEFDKIKTAILIALTVTVVLMSAVWVFVMALTPLVPAGVAIIAYGIFFLLVSPALDRSFGRLNSR